ncbi:MAG: hypothetical protein BJ554DRAFT_2533, partial [Olpidium bornovanus]
RRARHRELKAEAARAAEEAERERVRREKEAERDRAQREEEERRRKEEAAAIEAERQTRLAKEQEEDAERQRYVFDGASRVSPAAVALTFPFSHVLRKLAEQFERQRARDAEIERKLAEQSRSSTSSRNTPPASAEPAAFSAASAGKYVPPHRGQGGGASPSLPRRDFSSPSSADSGSWRRESREKLGTSTAGNNTVAAAPSSSSLRGSSESLASTGSGSSRPLFGTSKAGGWRDRAARKAAEEPAAKDADGFTEVRRK